MAKAKLITKADDSLLETIKEVYSKTIETKNTEMLLLFIKQHRNRADYTVSINYLLEELTLNEDNFKFEIIELLIRNIFHKRLMKEYCELLIMARLEPRGFYNHIRNNVIPELKFENVETVQIAFEAIVKAAGSAYGFESYKLLLFADSIRKHTTNFSQFRFQIFEILSHYYLHANQYVKYLNCLYRMAISTHRGFCIDKDMVSVLYRISKNYIDENDEFLKPNSYQDTKTLIDKLNSIPQDKTKREDENTIKFFGIKRQNIDYERWEHVLNNTPMEINIANLRFLELNNINALKRNNFFVDYRQKKETFVEKIYHLEKNLKKHFEKEEVVVRKIEAPKPMQKPTKMIIPKRYQEIKPKPRKRLVVDYFRRRFNMFRKFSSCFQPENELEATYKEKEKHRKKIAKNHANEMAFKFELVSKYENLIDEMLVELEEKKGGHTFKRRDDRGRANKDENEEDEKQRHDAISGKEESRGYVRGSRISESTAERKSYSRNFENSEESRGYVRGSRMSESTAERKSFSRNFENSEESRGYVRGSRMSESTAERSTSSAQFSSGSKYQFDKTETMNTTTGTFVRGSRHKNEKQPSIYSQERFDGKSQITSKLKDLSFENEAGGERRIYVRGSKCGFEQPTSSRNAGSDFSRSYKKDRNYNTDYEYNRKNETKDFSSSDIQKTPFIRGNKFNTDSDPPIQFTPKEVTFYSTEPKESFKRGKKFNEEQQPSYGYKKRTPSANYNKESHRGGSRYSRQPSEGESQENFVKKPYQNRMNAPDLSFDKGSPSKSYVRSSEFSKNDDTTKSRDRKNPSRYKPSGPESHQKHSSKPDEKDEDSKDSFIRGSKFNARYNQKK